jgi:hypothetical protein
MISLDDLLKKGSRHLDEERPREGPLRLKFLFGSEEVEYEERTSEAR